MIWNFEEQTIDQVVGIIGMVAIVFVNILLLFPFFKDEYVHINVPLWWILNVGLFVGCLYGVLSSDEKVKQ